MLGKIIRLQRNMTTLDNLLPIEDLELHYPLQEGDYTHLLINDEGIELANVCGRYIIRRAKFGTSLRCHRKGDCVRNHLFKQSIQDLVCQTGRCV